MNRLLVIAALAGFTAGIAIGVLIAPEKGEEIRKKVSEAVGTWTDKLIGMFGKSAESLLPSGVEDTVNPNEILG
jgi:gas vesicle protein